MNTLTKQLIGEFIGSFILGFFGLAVAVNATIYGSIHSNVEVGFAFALIIAVCLYIFNSISGASFNPAVTLCMGLYRGFPKKNIIPYWAAQLLGWGCGATLLYIIFGNDVIAFEETKGIVRGTVESMASAGIFFCTTSNGIIGIATEALLTALHLTFVLAITDPKNPWRPNDAISPLVIGLVFGFMITIGASITGAALNPARDFAPRVVAWLFGWGEAAFPGKWYVYIIGPLSGAAIGGALYTKFLRNIIITVDPSYKED